LTLVYGYNTQTVGNPFWADRPPRNQSRTDVAELNLYDGGHGNQAITKNPIFAGLGLTLRMALNQFAQSFVVEITDVEADVTVDISNQFERIGTTRVYELRGRAGFGALNPAARPPGDYTTTRTFKVVVTTTNVTISNRIEYLLYIGYEADVRSCSEPRLDDLTMLQCLRENFIHIWKDHIVPLRQPGDSPNQPLYLFFDQADQLAKMVPCMCECFNWYQVVTTAFKFFVVGDGAAADAAAFPNAAGCNPWDEITQIPDDGAGGQCTLPPGYQTTGCP
jgi:hypothetical protein